MNIFRDPRWGRGHETYGEDPFLTGRLGVAFELNAADVEWIDPEGQRVMPAGRFVLTLGGSQGDARSVELGAVQVQTITVTLA